jgi:hypothetical protein
MTDDSAPPPAATLPSLAPIHRSFGNGAKPNERTKARSAARLLHGEPALHAFGDGYGLT